MMPTEPSNNRQSSNITHYLKCAACGRSLTISNSCIDKERWEYTDEIICEILPCRCQTKILDDLRNAARALLGMDDEYEKRIIAELTGTEGRPQARAEMLAEMPKNIGLPLDSEPEQVEETKE